jgi:uncharacterized protein
MSKEIETPCVAICRTDSEGVCIGCGRTQEEIAEWWDYTDSERKTIMDRLQKEINDLFD